MVWVPLAAGGLAKSTFAGSTAHLVTAVLSLPHFPSNAAFATSTSIHIPWDTDKTQMNLAEKAAAVRDSIAEAAANAGQAVGECLCFGNFLKQRVSKVEYIKKSAIK